MVTRNALGKAGGDRGSAQEMLGVGGGGGGGQENYWAGRGVQQAGSLMTLPGRACASMCAPPPLPRSLVWMFSQVSSFRQHRLTGPA